MREGVAYKTGFNSIKLFKNRQPRKLVAVAYSCWSFTRGSNWKKNWCLRRWLLIGGDGTWKFDCTGNKVPAGYEELGVV